MEQNSNIFQYFEHIISAIREMEKNSEIFSELKTISHELEILEQYVKNTLQTLENNFNTYVYQINLLSELVDFQRSVMNFKTTENMLFSLFDFLNRNLHFDHAFIALKLEDAEEKYTLITNRKEDLELYERFVAHEELGMIRNLLRERDMAYLMADVHQFSSQELPWQNLGAKSVILFPVKVRGRFFGMGFLIRQKKPFDLSDLSFVNLIIGLISMMVYLHFYSSRLKTRLFKQFRYRKMLEEAKYSEYLEKGPLFIFTLDPRFIILHANARAIKSLQTSEDMIIGDNFLDYIPREHRNGIKKVLANAEEGKVLFYRSPIETDDKVPRVFEFYISRVELRNHFNLLLVFAVDMTQRIYKENLLRRNEVLDELDQFSRTLIGEFNNLLTILMPNISLLRTQLEDDHPFQQQFDTMEKAITRSSNFIQKFLNYDLQELEMAQKGNINKIVKSFIAQFKKEIPADIDIQFQLDPNVHETTIYPLRLRRLLEILLENSVLALKDKEFGEIRLSTRMLEVKSDGLLKDKPFYLNAGRYLELNVYDNGCGIPPKIVNQVFKPFYSTRIKNEGVGLGLFIAYNIVKDMNGQIFIESEVEKFTQVFIYLPVKEEPKMQPSVVKRKRIPAREKIKEKPTVLIVDDEYNIRSIMKEIMEMNGFRVFTAGNGEEGVDIVRKHKGQIDLVILDMVMPIMDGRTAFLEMKKIDPDQKILIISGYSRREDLDEILQKGAVGFMRKPFQVFEIVNRVKEILKIRARR